MPVRAILRHMSMTALAGAAIVALAAAPAFAAGKRERPTTRPAVTHGAPAQAGKVSAASKAKTAAPRRDDRAAREAMAASEDPPPQSRPARPLATQTPPPPPPRYSSISNPRGLATRPAPPARAVPATKPAPAQKPAASTATRTAEKQPAAKPVQQRQTRTRANSNIRYRRRQ